MTKNNEIALDDIYVCKYDHVGHPLTCNKEEDVFYELILKRHISDTHPWQGKTKDTVIMLFDLTTELAWMILHGEDTEGTPKSDQDMLDLMQRILLLNNYYLMRGDT